jgi:hypothetical protein
VIESVQQLLKDLDYPASKEEIVDHAERRSADDEVLRELRSLPPIEYRTKLRSCAHYPSIRRT